MLAYSLHAGRFQLVAGIRKPGLFVFHDKRFSQVAKESFLAQVFFHLLLGVIAAFVEELQNRLVVMVVDHEQVLVRIQDI